MDEQTPSPPRSARAAPSPEDWALLTPLERVGFRIGDLFARYLSRLTLLWHHIFIAPIIWLAICRRRRVVGLEPLQMSRDHRAVIVANHRSFFDFFVVVATLRRRRQCPPRVLFPVRSSFFYDHPLGIAVNFFLSGMCMFPPIVRDKARSAFNNYALRRVVAEADVPATIVGLHPEGTRNKGPNPYEFLRAQPGVGRMLLDLDEGVRVIPVFILGLSNSLWTELIRNWTAPEDHPMYLVFGPDMDLSDLRASGSRPATQKRASDRCLEAIGELARHQQTLADPRMGNRSGGGDDPATAAG